MITDNEWNKIAAKAFPQKTVQAPPFLWTRILSGILAEENRVSSTWWLQWRWMGRLTATVGVLVALGAFYLIQHEATPLEAALDGRSSQEQALQLASMDTTSQDTSAAGMLVGLDS
jgi:hypothetical protein